MSSSCYWDELHFFILPTSLFSSLPTFNTFLITLLLLASLYLLLSPGGLPWALANLTTKTRPPSIPGPSGLPILGLLPTLSGSLTHRSLRTLSRSFNALPLMAFSVGLTRFIVASTPATAKEILNSSAFGDRPVKESAYELLFNRAMGFAPSGDYWRALRRIAATRFFNSRRVMGEEEGGRRRREGMKMVKVVERAMEKEGVVEVRKVLHGGSLRNVMATVFGREYESGFDEEEEYGLVDGLVEEGYELLGLFNWSDHFPLLKLLDLQGVRKRSRQLASKVNLFVGGIIDEHIEERRTDGCCRRFSSDFVHVLLDLEKENRLPRSDMIALLWEMVFRGTDTVAILVEWAMARMVVDRGVQEKVRREIEGCVGRRGVRGEDIARMPYLRAVVKETLRVHPPGPLLSWARLAVHDTTVGGMFVPAGTTAMVNMWAISRDERVWEKGEEFRPERFMEGEEEVSVMGSDLRVAPFGAGRRVCPGRAMAMANAELWLAQLVQNFEWAEGKKVDMGERLKMSMEMKRPLVCIAVRREVGE